MTLTFSDYGHSKVLSINISDLVNKWSVVINYKDDRSPDGYTHFINALVDKDFYIKERDNPKRSCISIISNTFHDTLYDQSWYIDMIRGLFTSGLFAYYIDKPTFISSGITDGCAPEVNDNSP